MERFPKYAICEDLFSLMDPACLPSRTKTIFGFYRARSFGPNCWKLAGPFTDKPHCRCRKFKLAAFPSDNARKQPLGRSMEAISHKHIFTEKSKLLPSKPYLCLHLFKNSKTPQTTWRQLGGSGSGGRSKRYTYEITDLNIINFRKKIHFN